MDRQTDRQSFHLSVRPPTKQYAARRAPATAPPSSHSLIEALKTACRSKIDSVAGDTMNLLQCFMSLGNPNTSFHRKITWHIIHAGNMPQTRRVL